MESRVIAVKYEGPSKGAVGYQPTWRQLIRWRHVLPAILLANALLQVGDVLSTWYALSHGAIEANPVSRGLMADWGFSGWAWSKLALATLFLAHVPFLGRLDTHSQRKWLGEALAVFAGLMLAIVLANVAQTLIASGAL